MRWSRLEYCTAMGFQLQDREPLEMSLGTCIFSEGVPHLLLAPKFHLNKRAISTKIAYRERETETQAHTHFEISLVRPLSSVPYCSLKRGHQQIVSCI